MDNTSNATERAATATLTNKTLTSPTINGTVAGSATFPPRTGSGAAEAWLSNPAGNGYLLRSTAAGVRSWVAPLDVNGSLSINGDFATLGDVYFGSTFAAIGLVSLADSFVTGGAVTFAGGYSFSAFLTGSTSITFPTSGTLGADHDVLAPPHDEHGGRSYLHEDPLRVERGWLAYWLERY